MLRSLFWILSVLILVQCTQPASPLTSYFAETPPATDTLLIVPEASPDSVGQAITPATLQPYLDEQLFDSHPFGTPDSTYSRLTGHWILPLNPTHSLYLLEYRENWFVSKNFLVWSKLEQQFTTLQPVAVFFGGEGGQTWVEGRLFDWKEEDTPTVLLRSADHGLIPRGDSLLEYSQQYAGLLEWREGQFEEVPVSDSVQWIEQYPLEWWK